MWQVPCTTTPFISWGWALAYLVADLPLVLGSASLLGESLIGVPGLGTVICELHWLQRTFLPRAVPQNREDGPAFQIWIDQTYDIRAHQEISEVSGNFS